MMGFNWGGTTMPEKSDMGTMKPLLKPSSMMQAEATAGAPVGTMTAGISISVTEAETQRLARVETTLWSNRSMGNNK